MLYLTIFIVLLYLSYKYDYYHHTRGRKEWYMVMLITFILVAGLRYRLGVDSTRYEYGYLDLPTLSELFSGNFDADDSHYGMGYIFLNAIARSLSDDFTMMQFLQAIYVNVIIFWFFRKNTQNIFFALLIYFTCLYLNFMCEVMREACAAATLLWAWKYFVRGAWVKYYILAFLCYLFHPSGIIALALPIFYLPFLRPLFRIGKRSVFVYIGFLLVGIVVASSFGDYIELFAFAENVYDSAQRYEDSELSGNVLNIFGIISTLLGGVIYSFISIYIIRKYNDKDESGLYVNEQLYNKRFDKKYKKRYIASLEFMVSWCCIVAVLSVPLTLFYRYNNYFFPFAIIAICDCLFRPIHINGVMRKIRFSSWLIILFPFFFIQIYGYFNDVQGTKYRDYMRYYPYNSRIDMQKDANREKVFQLYNGK